MDDHRDMRLHQLRRLVMSGEYRVDPQAVADAIIRQESSLAPATEPSCVAGILSGGSPASRRGAGGAARRSLSWHPALTRRRDHELVRQPAGALSHEERHGLRDVPHLG